MFDKQLIFHEDQCIYCKKCAKICSNHKFLDYGHIIDFNSCNCCGNCCGSCDGLEICGFDASSDMVINEILKDLVFYNNSGGGLTISGGEPLVQVEFVLDLLKKAKDNHIHTCIETDMISPK